MSKAIKTVARIALPIVGGIVGGPVGAAIGGAIGGAAGGGGIKGAILGGATGYLGAASGGAGSLIGTAAKTVPAGVYGPVSPGSGILGALTGGGARALTQGVTQAATDPSKLLLGIGNQLMSEQGAQTAEKAARTQAEGIQQGVAANTAAMQPYTQLGQTAVNQLNTIQADPAGYIQGNPLYQSLASDAERRLLANQAAKGKVGSGGTAAALQENLLNLGTGLINQDLNRYQQQAGMGQNAAANVGQMQATGASGAGAVQSAGQIGSYDAYKQGYQNQINTILALQGLQKTPVYSPSISL